MVLDRQNRRDRASLRSAVRKSSSWPAMVLTVASSVLGPPGAAAQTLRGTEIIERALAARPDEQRGATLYRELCVSCHGRNAHGNPSSGTPSLAGQLTIYLVKQLADFSEGDRNDAEMHRVISRKQLSTPQALRDVASYLSILPANKRPEFGDGTDLAVGKRYYDGLCAFCHGQRGEGNEQHATPSLQRQHYSYLLAQSRQLPIGHRYSVPVEATEVLEKLPLDSLAAICDYASRLPDVSGPATDHSGSEQKQNELSEP